MPQTFYDKDAQHYEERHGNATTRHLRRQEQRLLLRFARGDVLDVGCGTGYHLHLLERKKGVRSLTGVDSSKEMVKIARKHASMKIVRHDAADMPFGSRCFDTIVCFNTMNFLGLPAFSEMRRVLRKGGTLIVSVASVHDNKGRSHKNIRINRKRLVMHLYEKHEFVSLLEAHGFRLVEFHSLFHLQQPYWNWFRSFTPWERLKLFAETFIQRDGGHIYLAVFRKN